MRIPFVSFEYMNKDIEEITIQTFKSFFHSKNYILGSYVEHFEKEYATYNQTQFALGVSNGLDALFLALKSLDIGKGDEVILPAHTFIASVLAVSYTGAKPIFVDSDLQTYNIDTTKIESVVTRRTKAIIPVHLYGQPCDMGELIQIAKNNNLYVIEDNAQAHGATFNNIRTGSFGNINATSFYPAKNLGAFGDGGAITTNSEILAERVKLLRNYGSKRKYSHEIIGYNKRLDECQASFLSVKMKFLDKWNNQRIKIAALYNHHLSSINNVILPKIHHLATSVYHLYVIRCKNRDYLKKFLQERGISTLIHYPVPPYLQPCYQNLNIQKGTFPNAEKIAATCISLPIYPGMKESDIIYIKNQIANFFYSS